VAGLRADGAGFRADVAGFRADAAGLETEAAGFRVDVEGFRVATAGFRVEAAGLVVAAAALALVAVARFAAGLARATDFAGLARFDVVRRATAGFAADGLPAAAGTVRPTPAPDSGPPIGATLTGETDSTAWAAAAPTSLAAPPTLPPTVAAAFPAADAARLAILPAIAATS
jgi:hypothetical protein